MHTLVPGKVILTGEYGALFGAPTLVTALSPPYQCIRSESGAVEVSSGLGPGFGSSTGHFFMRHKRELPLNQKDVKELRRIFRDECDLDQVKPSGVDIVAQLSGGSVLVQGEEFSQVMVPSIVLDQLWIARPQGLKKINTQQALASEAAKVLVCDAVKKSLREKWAEACEASVDSIMHADWEGLASYQMQIEAFAESAQVIAPEVVSLLRAVRSDPEVRFIKGCGALFQDVFLIYASDRARAGLAKEFEFIGRLQDHFSSQGVRVG